MNTQNGDIKESYSVNYKNTIDNTSARVDTKSSV